MGSCPWVPKLRERNWRRDNRSCTTAAFQKRKYTDTESENDECDKFDELKQSLPNSEKLVLDSFMSDKLTEYFVLSNIGEFPDLNENDLSAADIGETTLKKLLDDV